MACVLTLGASYAQEPKSSISGRVVNSVSGSALRKVSLTLTPTRGDGKPVTAITGDAGQFEFRDLAPGGYRLSGERSGFARQDYGARTNPQSGAILALQAGQAITDLTFKLAPNAVISGRVIDQDGEPLPNVVVTALRRAYRNGRRLWSQSGGTQTNDRGEYRISGLRAGRYVIGTANLGLDIGLAGVSKDAPSSKPEPAYTTTYYGNATDLLSAEQVDVRFGEDRRGTDIQMARVPTVRVRGKVVGAAGGSMLIMTLIRKASGEAGSSPGGVGLVQQADGTFELRGIAPGSYFLSARSATDPMGGGAPMPVEVAGEHIDGLEYHLGQGEALSGTVKMLGNGTETPASTTVVLEAVDLPSTRPSTTPADDGSFTIKSFLPGKYRVRLDRKPAECYLKSVKVGGREVDSEAAELTASGTLEIAVGRAGAQVDGVVQGGDDKPVPGATVVLIPSSGRAAHYLSATTDYDGTFSAKGAAPGKYKMLAWEEIEPGAFLDPEFVKPFEAGAEQISLEEGGRAKVTLKVIPYSARTL